MNSEQQELLNSISDPFHSPTVGSPNPNLESTRTLINLSLNVTNDEQIQQSFNSGVSGNSGKFVKVVWGESMKAEVLIFLTFWGKSNLTMITPNEKLGENVRSSH